MSEPCGWFWTTHLSVHRQLIEPKVSTVDKDLHNTFSFDKDFAILTNDNVMATGRPSGTNATMTETTLIKSWEVLMNPG